MWRECLPADKIEQFFWSIIIVCLSIGFGFGIGVLYMKESFEKGADYMQRAYMNGYVVREVVRTGGGGK